MLFPEQKKVTKEQRIEVRTLAREGYSYQKIARRLQVTYHQAHYAANAVHLSPKKSSGRPLVLSSEQVDEIEAFVVSSPEHHQLTCFELAYAHFSHFGVSEKVIQRAMSRRGDARRIAASKPPLSAENKRKRLEFATKHLDWNKEDWMRVLWIDETWVTGVQHSSIWITKKVDENFDATCVISDIRKKIGWMFSGSFFGSEKGPSLIWEKEWGSITADRYCQRIDNAPPYRARQTMDELRERNISPITWPPYSPDMNPIEHVWKLMKDYIAYHYPDLALENNRSQDELRRIMAEACDRAVDENEVEKLVESMPSRIRAVYEAQGGPTKY
ncbi:hypothetical protein K3495_g9749 [Podosphaera aphanis]|nr:hypothetical protein K3495_g9749 [Podosphaera aphanis]